MDSQPTTPDAAALTHAVTVSSNHLDTQTAGTEVAHLAAEQMDGHCDLALLFGSFHHAAAFGDAAANVRRMVQPNVLVGTTASSVLGSSDDLENRPGMMLVCIRCDGMKLHPFHATVDNPMPLNDSEAMRERIGLQDEHAVTLFFADPFTTPVPRVLGAMAMCRNTTPYVPVAGGVSSGSTRPGVNRLVMNDEAIVGGAVGVSIGGDVRAEFLVSLGARPIGKPMVVTSAKDHTLLSLGGNRAFDVMQELAKELNDDDRKAMARGMLIGTVIEENRRRFGRGDFLVRNILGYDNRVGGILTGEKMRLGKTIQFHVRDPHVAREDLHMLLDKQQLMPKPFAALLFDCNGRGDRLFDSSNHDARLIHERLQNVPVGGFFAAGEIGPVGTINGAPPLLHAYSASAVLLRHASAV